MDQFFSVPDIKNENRDVIVKELTRNLFGNEIYRKSEEYKDEELLQSISGPDVILRIIDSIDGEFTTLVEDCYVDKVFRDSYYMYFSNQHFEVDRYCKRISFFEGAYNPISFTKEGLSNPDLLSSKIIATCVLIPINGGILGRCLLSPKRFLKEEKVFIRTSVFKIHIYGISIRIEAFPFHMQDRETMRCSEVTLLNLLEYFSNEYEDYKSLVPSDIIQSERIHNHERVLPSRGMTYHTLTKVLAENGFAPRLYNINAMERVDFSGMNQEIDIKRILHYYIESGIPVAVNVEPKGRGGSGHSLICIGHSADKNHKVAFERGTILGDDTEGEYCIINSADYYDNYIVIDDNQFPYSRRHYTKMSIYSGMKITNISVPLYKRMFLEATDAYDVFMEILVSESWGVKRLAADYLKDSKTIVNRVFLASSRSYKAFRVSGNSEFSDEWMLYYANLRLPRFVWICELYTPDGYEKTEPFAEIVLDATSAAKQGIQNVILMNYPGRLYARNPNQGIDEIDENSLFIKKGSCRFSSYCKNLFPNGFSGRII